MTRRNKVQQPLNSLHAAYESSHSTSPIPVHPQYVLNPQFALVLSSFSPRSPLILSSLSRCCPLVLLLFSSLSPVVLFTFSLRFPLGNLLIYHPLLNMEANVKIKCAVESTVEWTLLGVLLKMQAVNFPDCKPSSKGILCI